LSVKGNQTIEDCIQQYVASENLVGDNQYEIQGVGKKNAIKYIEFVKLPPVL